MACAVQWEGEQEDYIYIHNPLWKKHSNGSSETQMTRRRLRSLFLALGLGRSNVEYCIMRINWRSNLDNLVNWSWISSTPEASRTLVRFSQGQAAFTDESLRPKNEFRISNNFQWIHIRIVSELSGTITTRGVGSSPKDINSASTRKGYWNI